MTDTAKLKAAAEKATPGRIGDRIDGTIKYRCVGVDGSLVLQTDHKNDEYGFIGDNGEADELFFRLCTPESVLELIAALEAALAAAQQPVWDGEGLPPVGCECEFFDCEKWFKVTMMYGGSQLVVLYDHDNQIERSFSTSRIDGKFRPIRSEADRKRDEIAKDINAAVDASGTLGHVLYDAIAAGNIPHIRIE